MAQNQKLFRIGDLARLFHIGVDSIRYYEKVGLLHPVRGEENNYRLYTLDDVRTMNTIRELLELGFHTDEILRFEKDRNLHHVADMLKKESDVIDREMAELKAKKKNIQARLRSIREDLGLDCSGTIHLLTLPERACLKIADSDMPDNMINLELARFTIHLPEKVSTICACDCYTLDISSTNAEGNDYRTKNVFFYSPYMDFPCNFALPAGQYLSVCYRGSFEKTRTFVPKLLSFAKENGLVPAGDPSEFCHIDRYETSCQEEYLTEIQLPVRGKDA